jgi:4-hydroxy-tetrahydrodipicolinate reductase
MGRMLADAVMASPDLTLTGALDHAASPAIGQVLGSVRITAALEEGLAGAQLLIDFTRPEGSLRHLAACRERGVAMVIGTTGFDAAGKAAIGAAAQHIPIVLAPNMSVGVNVMLRLLGEAARTLGEAYDVEVIEVHHRHKVDAPSGTALAMGEAVATAQGKTLADCAVYAREGHTGERRAGTIGFSTIRGGDIIGEHTVMFAGSGERIEISHKSASRANYVEGSLRAARFVVGRPPGLYGMADVLGL